MKLPDLEEQQGRNIYLSLSKYLSPCCREQRPLFKKMLLTLYGPMTGITFQLGPITIIAFFISFEGSEQKQKQKVVVFEKNIYQQLHRVV